MYPNTDTNILKEIKDSQGLATNEIDQKTSTTKRKYDIVWRNVFLFILLHLAAVYGIYLSFFKVLWLTLLCVLSLGLLSGLGITAGAHRLWTHRSYKARLPLQIFLVLINTLALQDAVVDWARDHRLHHKYTDTDADPYNAKRGFFFSHIGWLLVRKHQDIKTNGKTIDISDLTSDPILKFQKKYFLVLATIICFIIPAYVATLWGESLWNAFFTCSILRYVLSLHATWSVNSAAHMWGNKPYDKYIGPVENKIVSFLSMGEGFHNFHHTFPWDYKTGELGGHRYNVTTVFIDFMASIGWAYDLKVADDDVIQNRIQRTGDGSYTKVMKKQSRK